MSEYHAYSIEHDFGPMVDEIAAKIQHRVDQAALDKAADTLAEYGYVKVVRCRDCAKADWFGAIGYGEFTCRVHGWTSESNDGFCAWAKRNGGGDD